MGVEQGGKAVVGPAAVVGAPGFACCIAASRVAISAGEGVGNSASGEANTGEVEVVEELPLLPVSAVAQGVGDGFANVGVCSETGGGVAAGAQADTTNRQAQTASLVANL